jgi:hypothetical protein
MFSLQQSQRIREENRFCLEAGCEEELVQIIYTHVSKCKNHKKNVMWTGNMAQAVVCLPSKCEALNLNPSTNLHQKKSQHVQKRNYSIHTSA